MKLPRVAHPEGYRGLYVVDFGATCSVGYTAEEVALLLESEAYADAKVYRICRARPDGTMELKGVPRERFMLETGLFFYSRDLASGRRDYDQLRALAGSEPLPCRAQLLLGGFREPRREKFVVGLAFPAEYEDDVARWMLDHDLAPGERAAGGMSLLEAVRRDARIIDSAQLRASAGARARPMEELLARIGEPIQRIA